MNLQAGESNKSIPVLKDPFNKNSIRRVSINFSSGIGMGYWWGSVEFENGNTQGSQKFEVKDPEGFKSIVSQIDEFVKSL